jgi:thymidylate synthase ThyX
VTDYFTETFTDEERAILSRFFTNVDGPVFGLVNLPEVVKGALFARYSRSPKSVRRLFLDEFMTAPDTGITAIAGQMEGDPLIAMQKAEGLYQRVFFEYGDDSVAQLGGVHLACEQASNILTKVLEWGRLAAYLEQSTRYIWYDRKLGGRYRYHVPAEVIGSDLEAPTVAYLDWLFTTYSSLIESMKSHFEARFPKEHSDSQAVYNATIRAKACDTIRGLLPAATTSNVGIYGTGQAYEMALIRMNAHPLAEVRDYAAMMLTELRKMIPSFLRRVDLPDRGGAWSEYLSDTANRISEIAEAIDDQADPIDEVTLVDFDPDGEVKLVAAALYAQSELPDAHLHSLARSMSLDERAAVLAACVGDRGNRRHKPGRAFEHTTYRFDILSDYGNFRDLQRHRMLTIEWQRLTTRHGYVTPGDITETGNGAVWDEAMTRAADLYERIRTAHGPEVAQYVVPFAYKIRYMMEMNAREAFHLIELRTQPAGHPGYRRVCQEMHRLIRDEAGHRAVADAMRFVDYTSSDLERLESERRSEARRAGGRSDGSTKP